MAPCTRGYGKRALCYSNNGAHVSGSSRKTPGSCPPFSEPGLKTQERFSVVPRKDQVPFTDLETRVCTSRPCQAPSSSVLILSVQFYFSMTVHLSVSSINTIRDSDSCFPLCSSFSLQSSAPLNPRLQLSLPVLFSETGLRCVAQAKSNSQPSCLCLCGTPHGRLFLFTE